MQALTKGRYAARLAEDAGDLARALALRHRRFRAGRGRTARTSDADAFDPACRHMLISDTGTGELLCCYRVMTFARGADLSRGYAAQFYDLTPLSAITAPVIELGRFCLHPDHNDPDILRLAWAALTRLVDAAGAVLLFGCSSFDGADPAAHSAALGHLARHHLGPASQRPVARDMAVALAPFATRAVDRPALPPLLRSYLAMGGWVSDHAVSDHDLDTLHVFTALPIAAIPPGRAAALRALATS